MLIFIPNYKKTAWGSEITLCGDHSYVFDDSKGVAYKAKHTIPFIIKILESKKDLSLQVHPHEQNEVWVVADGKQNGAKSDYYSDTQYIAGLKWWAKLWMLKVLPRKLWSFLCQKHYFISYCPVLIQNSTIHSLLKGNRVLEIQDKIEGGNKTFRFGDLDPSMNRAYQFEEAYNIADQGGVPIFLKNCIEPYIDRRRESFGLFYLFSDIEVGGKKYKKNNLIFGDIGDIVKGAEYPMKILKIRYNGTVEE